MLLFTNIYKLPVKSISEGITVGLAKDIIIDPENGKVLGFILDKTQFKERNIITMDDIREIDHKMMIINDSQALSTRDEVIRINEVLNKKIRWMGLRVETDIGRKMGKIEDLAIDFRADAISRIYASGGIIKELFSLEKIIIPATKIISVTEKMVIIEDDYITAKELKKIAITETA